MCGKRAAEMWRISQRAMRTLMKVEFCPYGEDFRYVSKQTEVMSINFKIKDLLATLLRGKTVLDRKRLHGVFIGIFYLKADG